MQKITTAICIAATALCLSACHSDAATTQTDVSAEANKCLACHQGKRSFAGRDDKQLASQIKLIRDKKLSHPPLKLADSSDEAIERLAAQLGKTEQ